jgi:hypothetical protein
LARAAAGAGIVGREDEVTALDAFVADVGRPSALVITGGPGIGKTTLWEAGIDIAQVQGMRVLLARPSGAEAQLAYATLIDLLDHVSTTELELPRPQRRALEIPILRADPGSRAVEPRRSRSHVATRCARSRGAAGSSSRSTTSSASMLHRRVS